MGLNRNTLDLVSLINSVLDGSEDWVPIPFYYLLTTQFGNTNTIEQKHHYFLVLRHNYTSSSQILLLEPHPHPLLCQHVHGWRERGFVLRSLFLSLCGLSRKFVVDNRHSILLFICRPRNVLKLVSSYYTQHV